MKFTKTALTLALVAASGSAMAASTGNPSADNNAFNAIAKEMNVDARITKTDGGNIVLVDGDKTIYLTNKKDGEIVKNEANIEKVQKALIDKRPVGINPPVMPTPILGSDEQKRNALNHIVKGVERSAEVMVGGESITISNVEINKDGTINYSVTRSDGTTTDLKSEYVMDGTHKAKIAEGVQKERKDKVDPITPPGIGPVEPGNPDNGPGIEDPVGPINGGEGRAAYDSIVEAGQNLEQAGQSAYSTMNEIYDLGNQNAQDIDTLFSEVDRLDERIDGVMASAQAVTAARPYLSTNQTNSVGVGVGYAGDVAAVAVGYAHRINPNWTANANVSATTGNDVDVSAGAGVSYAW